MTSAAGFTFAKMIAIDKVYGDHIWNLLRGTDKKQTPIIFVAFLKKLDKIQATPDSLAAQAGILNVKMYFYTKHYLSVRDQNGEGEVEFKAKHS